MKTKTLATLVIAAFATVACTNNKTMESGIKLENLDTKAVRSPTSIHALAASTSWPRITASSCARSSQASQRLRMRPALWHRRLATFTIWLWTALHATNVA